MSTVRFSDEFIPKMLVDPIDKSPLRMMGDVLQSTSGRTFPIVQGVPVMLVDGVDQTIRVAERTLDAVHQKVGSEDPWCLDTTVMEGRHISELKDLLADPSYRPLIDPVISFLVGKTNGQLYQHLVGNLKSYPIPDIPVPRVNNAPRQTMLDIGCSWGRWSLSAARKGYDVVALDPSLGAILAGRRAATQMGVVVHWVVGDVRYLPFRDNAFDYAFSYGVIQHFNKPNVETALQEVRRVLLNKGVSLIQMPNAWGLRSFYHELRRGFREPQRFEVRYYTPRELLNMFQSAIGPSTLSADGFFGLGIQRSDASLMPLKYKTVIYASEMLRRCSQTIPFLRWAADSLYIESKKAM
jgi:SAM-dependent methyltransferase/uncharacterized protein YbaR (Trm112 family)